MPDGGFDVEGLLQQGAAGRLAPPAPVPGSFPMVAPHLAPDGSGSMTNLSDQDFGKFKRGEAPTEGGAGPAAAQPSDQAAPFDVESLLGAGVAGKAAAPTMASVVAQKPSLRSMGKNLAAGAVEGGEGVMNTMADPFGNLVGRPLAMGLSYAHDLVAPMFGGKAFTPEDRASLLGDDVPQIGTQIGQVAGRALGAPSTESIVPQNPQEESARRVGQGAAAGAAIGPGAIFPAVTGNLTGQAAAAAAGPYAGPAADLAGQMIGGGVGGGIQEGAIAAARSANPGKIGVGFGKQNYNGIRATASEAASVGNQLTATGGPELLNTLKSTGDASARVAEIDAKLGGLPPGAPERAALESERSTLVPQSREIVPGSQPTTAQLSVNPAVAGLENSLRVQNGEPFIERETQQNAARLAAMRGQAPDAGQVANVGKMFTDRLSALEGQQAAEVGSAATARGAAGGAPLGGLQRSEDYGAAMREQALAPEQEATKAQASRLYDAVDPDGTMTVNIAPAKAAAQEVLATLHPQNGLPAAGDVHPGVAKWAGAITQAPDVVPFSWLRQVRTSVGDVSREIRNNPQIGGESIPGRQSGMLSGGLDSSIEEAVNRALTGEAGGILQQRIADALDQAGEQSEAGRQNATGFGGQEGASGIDSGATGSVGTAVPARGRSGSASGSQSVPRAPLQEHITPEDAAAYRAANQFYREYKQTYRSGPVGKVLQQDANKQFRTADIGVPRQFFTAGDTNPQAVSAYLKASGGKEPALALARDYLVSELRHDGIVDAQTGALDQGKFARWQQRRAPAIKALGGDLATRLTKAAEAQKVYDETVARHEKAITDYQRGVAADFLKNDPEVAVSRALSSSDPQNFQRLAAAVKGNADAAAGLKRATVDWIVKKFSSATAASADENFLNARSLQKWIDSNKVALRTLFGGQGMQTFELVAADLRRQQQRIAAVPGSATASNLKGVARHGVGAHGGGSVLSFFLGEAGGAALGHMLGHGEIGGPLGSGAGLAFNALKQRAITTRADLLREAMLHPDLARTLMERVADGTPSPTLMRRVANRILVSTAANTAARGSEDKPHH